MNEQASAIRDLVSSLVPLERWYVVMTALVALTVYSWARVPFFVWPEPLQWAVYVWLGFTVALPFMMMFQGGVAALWAWWITPEEAPIARSTKPAGDASPSLQEKDVKAIADANGEFDKAAASRELSPAEPASKDRDAPK